MNTEQTEALAQAKKRYAIAYNSATGDGDWETVAIASMAYIGILEAHAAALTRERDAAREALELAPLLVGQRSEVGPGLTTVEDVLLTLGRMLLALPPERQETMEYRHMNAHSGLRLAREAASPPPADGNG